LNEINNLARLSDEVLTTRLQLASFSYLIDYANPNTGLVADTSRPGSPCSIAVVGFALSCLPMDDVIILPTQIDSRIDGLPG